MEMNNIPHAIFDFYEKMPRQGPGSEKLTKKLLQNFRYLLPSNPVAVDMGCGSGLATLILAEFGFKVTGVDIHQPFLDKMMEKAKEKGLDNLVKYHQSSMIETNFAKNEFDLIWSEGAIFTVGLENALKEFFPLLKQGGILGFSDCFYFQKNTPKDVVKQWEEWDCNIKTVAESLDIAEKLGYRFIHSEKLPPQMWEESFYQPMEKLIASIKADKSSPSDLLEMAESERHNMEFFRKNNAFYGYVFHILQKP
ncbi:MAG: class I SAM-dependent methyltransferase [Alphaproteobacteria bacterium]